jgi:hypothetical protein
MGLSITNIDNDTGVVSLSNGSSWQVAPGDLTAIVTWLPMHRVTLKGTGLTREFKNVDHGSTVKVTPAE